MALINKHQVFVSEYLKCFNGSEAARRAGYTGSDGAISKTAHDLLKREDIAAEVRQRLDIHVMTADEVLVHLADQARSDIADFLVVDGENVNVDLAKAVEAKKTGLIKRLKQTRTVRTGKDGETIETSVIDVELYDRQQALIQIGKVHKLFTERQEIATDMRLVVIDA
jgi:phage terminase small subunit